MSHRHAPVHPVAPPTSRAGSPHRRLRRELLMALVLTTPFVCTVRMAPDVPETGVRVANTAGSASPAFLGILTSPTSTEVIAVLPDSPAGVAGVRAGDVVESLGEQDVGDPRDLPRLLQDWRPGDLVVLGIRREGRRIELRARLASRRSDGAGPTAPR